MTNCCGNGLCAMLVTRKQKRNMRKDAALAGVELALPMVRELALPAAKWTVGQMEKMVQGIVSAFKTNGNSRQEIARVVAPLAQTLRVGSKAPKFSTSNGVVSIDHIESLKVAVDAGFFVIDTKTFTWLRDIASCFEEWRIKLEFCWNPVVSATTSGTSMMAFDYDPADQVEYPNVTNFFSTADHCVNAVWSPGAISPKQSGWLKTGVNGDPRLYSPGIFQFNTTNHTYGFYVVRYHVEFRKPQPPTDDGGAFAGTYTTGSTMVSNGTLVAGDAGGITLSASTITVPSYPNQYVLFIWSTDGTPGVMTASGSKVVAQRNVAGQSSIVFEAAGPGDIVLGLTTPAGGPTTWQLTYYLSDFPATYW